MLQASPDDPDATRRLVVDKGNLAPIPPGLRFRVEGGAIPNPVTGELVGTGRITEPVEDDAGYTLRDLSVTPTSKSAGPTREEQARALILANAADGAWHARAEAAAKCKEAGITGATFKSAFAAAPVEKRENETAQGKPVEYRLRRDR